MTQLASGLIYRVLLRRDESGRNIIQYFFLVQIFCPSYHHYLNRWSHYLRWQTHNAPRMNTRQYFQPTERAPDPGVKVIQIFLHGCELVELNERLIEAGHPGPGGAARIIIEMVTNWDTWWCHLLLREGGEMMASHWLRVTSSDLWLADHRCAKL